LAYYKRQENHQKYMNKTGKGDTMKKILLVSHGNFSKGIKQSLEVIVGSSEGVEAITIQKNTTRSQAKLAFDTFLESLQTQDQLFVLTDIMQGSTSQYVMEFIQGVANVVVVTGLNLGLLLELYVTDIKEGQQVDEIIEAARNSICRIDHQKNTTEDEI